MRIVKTAFKLRQRPVSRAAVITAIIMRIPSSGLVSTQRRGGVGTGVKAYSGSNSAFCCSNEGTPFQRRSGAGIGFWKCDSSGAG